MVNEKVRRIESVQRFICHVLTCANTCIHRGFVVYKRMYIPPYMDYRRNRWIAVVKSYTTNMYMLYNDNHSTGRGKCMVCVNVPMYRFKFEPR